MPAPPPPPAEADGIDATLASARDDIAAVTSDLNSRASQLAIATAAVDRACLRCESLLQAGAL